MSSIYAPAPPPREPDPAPDEHAATQKRRKVIAAVAASALVVAGAAAAMPFTSMMPVRTIAVEGNVNLPPEAVEEATGIELGTPIARVSVREAAASVAANPWVESATVARDWPNAVNVRVTEHVPVAWIDQGGEPHLIDRQGRDFVVADPPTGAVQLVNVAESQLGDAVDVASSISDKARPRVRSLTASGPYNFELVLDDDRTVVWGAGEDNHNKAVALEAVLQMEGSAFNISNPELVTVRP